MSADVDPVPEPSGALTSLVALARQSAVYLAGRVLPAVVGIAAIPFYTRLVEPAAMGRFALLSAVALLAGFAFNWLRVAVFRAMGGRDAVDHSLASTVLALFGATAAAIAGAESAGFLAFDRSAGAPAVALTVAMTITAAWFDLECVLLQAQQRVALYGMVCLVRAVVTFAVSLGLIRAGFRVEALLGGVVAGNCASLVLGQLWWARRIGRVDRELAASMIRFGWPSSVSSLLTQLATTVDRFILAAAAGTAALGVYAVAANLSRQSILLLVVATSLAGQPIAMRLYDREGRDAARRQLRLNARALVAVSLPAVIGLAMLAKPLAATLLGARYRDGAGIIFAMIALSAMLNGLRNYYFDQAFELARRTRPQAVISVVIVVVAIGASIALVPRFGAVGSATSAIIASVAGIAASVSWGRRIFAVPIPLVDWLKVAAACAAMAAVLAVLPTGRGLAPLIGEVALGAAVYVLSLASLFAHDLVPRRPRRGVLQRGASS